MDLAHFLFADAQQRDIGQFRYDSLRMEKTDSQMA
jgi:hypothetical protein